MHSATTLFLLCVIFVVFAPTGVDAFGAGDVPDFSYLNEKAFRHGDIESVLENLVKMVGRTASGGGLLGLASSVLSAATGGEKFGRMDVKRVYFGNWLRDYSQCMDIAGLSKLSADTLVMIVSVLGFMTFGFATEEFEVTADRLAVYLPVEHIDNPKGYAEKEGDARQFHSKLRPPVDPRELEIDERTGMKNYMATEGEGWDTSTAHVRRTFEACIEYGRRAQGREGADLWEAYRLLGTGLHTMEDLLAHSNWCELALRKMGHEEVFCHVGDNVIVETPNGPAPPLVTGTFGSADFVHSLMGEATDHISEASVTNLFDKMKQSGDADSSIAGLKDILSKLPAGGGSDKADEAESIKAKAFDFDPDKYAPKEVQEQLLQILRWRDEVYRDIIKKIEMVPGLNELMDQLTNALNAYIYTVLAPWLTPIMQQVTAALDTGSKAVIDSEDQYEVFDNPNASDPSHSILSKDHFSLILNEPAGKIARVVVENTVNLIVQAWSGDTDPTRVVDEILEAFHHPYYATGNSRIQNAMMDQLQRWFGGLGETEGRETLQALTKESIREGKNKRLDGADTSGEPGAQPTYSHRPQTQTSGYGSQESRTEYASGGYGGRQSAAQYSSNTDSYSRRNDDDGDQQGQSGRTYQEESEFSSRSDTYSRRDDDTFGRRQESYGMRQDDRDRPSDNNASRRDESSYEWRGDTGRDDRQEYVRSDETYSRRTETTYGRQDYEDDNVRGGRREQYGGDSYGRDDGREDSYNRSGGEQYGGYGHHGRQNQEEAGGYQPCYVPPGGGGGYGRREESDQPPPPRKEAGYGGYGVRQEGYGGGYGGQQEGYEGGYNEGRGGYGNEGTFGAERLNLEDEGEEYESGRRTTPARGGDYY